MSDSQRPNPDHARPPSFEVPDLELEPVPRALSRAGPARAAEAAPTQTLPPAQNQISGSSFAFGDDLDDSTFERTAHSNLQFGESAPQGVAAERAAPAAAEAGPSWPTGLAPEAAQLEIDRRKIALLADYGDPPESAPRTIGYAYRVFTRQRALKQQLRAIAADCERAQFEREATLAELSRALRPALENHPEFREFFMRIGALERRANEIEQRAALADLARAVLAARATVDVPEAWLERVRKVSDRADGLIVRAEMQRRAIACYDAEGARQGVRLACTAIGLLLLLFMFKLIF